MKTILITGGANGIGRQLVQSFASRGHRVLFADRDAKTGLGLMSKLRKQGWKVQYLFADLSERSSVRELSSMVCLRVKRLDVLVNNAAVFSSGTLGKRPENEWDHALAVNLTAPYLLVKYLLPLMPKGAAVVNIASTRALMSEPHTEPYSASKGGLLTLTHSLALSLADRRIRVNAVSPGWIDTSALQGTRGKKARLTNRDHRQHPAGRVGRPEDIAEAVLYLADGGRSGFVTGANLVVDGGMTRKMIYEE